jgi:hypothetical protein
VKLLDVALGGGNEDSKAERVNAAGSSNFLLCMVANRSIRVGLVDATSEIGEVCFRPKADIVGPLLYEHWCLLAAGSCGVKRGEETCFIG